MTTTSKNRHTEAQQAHWLEWLTGAVSAILILGMIGWVAGEAILQEETPPSFRSRVLTTTAVEGGHRVKFEILNQGTSTAAAVVVRAELMEAGRPVETAEVTFDYVPAKSRAMGGVMFSQDMGGRDIRLLAVGYTDP